MTAIAHLAVVPRDGLFCKDGRGWHTSASGRGHSLEWPWPSTLLGALRSAWGRRAERRGDALFGPEEWRSRTAEIRLERTLAIRRRPGDPWSTAERTWPVPLDAVWLEGRPDVYRLQPAPPTLPTIGRDDEAAREGLMRPTLDFEGKPLPSPRWWSDGAFSAWLTGKEVPVRGRRDEMSLARRIQVHVGIRPQELTTDEGMLFSHDVIETLEPEAEWAVGIEVALPDEERPEIATLGSDSRLARIEPLPPSLFEPPKQVLQAFRGKYAGFRLVTVTPACFERGWLPDGLVARDGTYRGTLAGLGAELILRAAFVPRPLHVSGWDMAARAPKPTSRMVAPGAVYFFERADGQPLTEADASGLWLAAVGRRTNEGFGRVVPGIWSR